MNQSTPSLTNSNNSPPPDVPPNDNKVTDTSHSGHQLKCDDTEFDSNKLIVDKDCTECNNTRPEPTASQLVMFLHALSYQVTIVTVTSLICNAYHILNNWQSLKFPILWPIATYVHIS